MLRVLGMLLTIALVAAVAVAMWVLWVMMFAPAGRPLGERQAGSEWTEIVPTSGFFTPV
jgi:hypothetical protein